MGKTRGLLLALVLMLLSLASLPAWCIDLSWGHVLQKESDRDLVRLYNNLTGPCPVKPSGTPGFVIERPGIAITFALRGRESRQEWKLSGKPSKVRTDPYRLCLADMKN